MKIVERYDLVDRNGFTSSSVFREAIDDIEAAISRIVWPPGASSFTVFGQSGKKRGEGNGVRPIRDAFVHELTTLGWSDEVVFPVSTPDSMADFGDMDAAKDFHGMPFLVEWETGNISSSHRAMNKMAIGLINDAVVGGVLVLPTKAFAKYLTDRIGNLWELMPYFDLWRAIDCESGYLGVIAIEHDAVSMDVPAIKKGTDGRALES